MSITRTIMFILTGLFSYIGQGYGANDHAVKGYTKKDGTYVAPTRATNPNRTQRDNYSSKGNYNPANGKEGTRNPKK